MKAFIYSKKTSKTIAVIRDVTRVEIYKKEITFVTRSSERLTFDTSVVKTTTYQN